MTNKTEMVSVPRELLSRITAQFMFSLRDSDYQALCALLAAPAEDVRAVGEEPVACMYDDGSVILPNDCVSQEVFDTICRVNTPLYRHPQRPVAPQCSEVTDQCSEHLRTQGRPVVLPESTEIDFLIERTAK